MLHVFFDRRNAQVEHGASAGGGVAPGSRPVFLATVKLAAELAQHAGELFQFGDVIAFPDVEFETLHQRYLKSRRWARNSARRLS